MRICVLMPTWECSFEDRLCGVVDILRQKGHEVQFCALMAGMKKRNEIHLPGFPEERLQLSVFQQRQLRPIRSLKELYHEVSRTHMVIVGSGKGLEKVMNVIVNLDVPFIQVNDIGHFFIPSYPADAIALNGEVVKKNILLNAPTIPESKIKTIGDLRFDKIVNPITQEQKSRFYQTYGLNPNKNFVVFCSGAVQRIEPWVARLYQDIVACVRQSFFELVLRLHPNDYAGHKKETTLGDVSARVLYPDVSFLHPGDWLTAMQLCACMIVVESTCIFESSIFCKHAVAVNYQEWCLTDEGREKEIFPRRRFEGFGLKSLYRDPKTGRVLQSEFLRRDIGMYRTEGIRWADYTWLGADCHISELSDVLRSSDLMKVNADLQQRHIQQYWYKVDGKAAQRLADLVDDLIKNAQIQRRLHRSSAQRVINTVPWIVGSRIEKFLRKSVEVISK